jgi:anti-anti-sigma factor
MKSMGERFKTVEAGELVISVAPHAESAVVHVGGVLDTEVAEVLTRELEALATFPDVEVDLNQLRIVDSAGINALADARARASGEGRSMRLKLHPGQVRSLLELAGVPVAAEAPL